MRREVIAFGLLIVCAAAAVDDEWFAENDPKDNYFRYFGARQLRDQRVAANDYDNLPKPFRLEGVNKRRDGNRRILRARRSAEDEALPIDGDANASLDADAPDSGDFAHFDDELKPLELAGELDLDALADNASDLPADINANNSAAAAGAGGSSVVAAAAGNDLVIDDFIRFKRNTAEKQTQEAPRTLALKGAKMLLAEGEQLPEGNREPRGLMKEQWLKQPYQIQTNDGLAAESADIPAAPRVHFVTQRRSESAPPLVYHSYERQREGRAREITRQRDMDLERDYERNYYPRPARHYSTGGIEDNFRDSYSGERMHRHGYHSYERNPERERERERYVNRFRNYVPQEHYYNDEERAIVPSAAKQKRIIYYATLPEIVRHRHPLPPPPATGGERYGSLDRFGAQPGAVGRGGGSDNNAMNYRFRNERPYVDETPKEGKVASPDVSVRALNKNPERRIYSEVGARYSPPGYKDSTFYQREENAYERNH